MIALEGSFIKILKGAGVEIVVINTILINKNIPKIFQITVSILKNRPFHKSSDV